MPAYTYALVNRLIIYPDMLKRLPRATSVVIKYEVSAQGVLSLETRGGTGIP